MPKIRFTIRTLLIATLLVALLALVWGNPPRNNVTLTVNAAGSVSIDGDCVAMSVLKSRLDRRQVWLSIWHKEPQLEVLLEKEWLDNMDPSTSYLPLVKTIKSSGFANPNLIVVDHGIVQ